MKGWTSENPFGLNESLLAMKSYIPSHTLYTISQFSAIAGDQSDRVPSPKEAFKLAKEKANKTNNALRENHKPKADEQLTSST